MYSRTLEARQSGPTTVDLFGYDSNIEITADPGCRRASIEVYTEASSGSTVEQIDALRLDESGGTVALHLPESASGGMQINNFSGGSFSSIQVGGSNRGIVMSGGGMVTIGGGDADMTVNGQRIKVRGGRTWVNGVEVTQGGAGGGEAPSDPPMPIHFRVLVPVGSGAIARTYNTNIRVADAAWAQLKTYNGDIRAVGLSDESRLKTYNGTITVGAADGAHPAVKAETYNGDIKVLDDNVRLRPKTYNGDVKYPN